LAQQQAVEVGAMTSRLRLAAQALLDSCKGFHEGVARTPSWSCVDSLRRALAEHAEEPGVPTVDECERIAFKAGFREGVEAAAEYLSQWAGYMISLNTIANVRALAQPAATGEGEP
jgi:hypothetical protein